MLRAAVNWEQCRCCDECAARPVCTTRAIVKLDRDSPAVVEIDRCYGCGRCLAACPFAAIGFGATPKTGSDETSSSRLRFP